jgi:tRNA-binding protein
MAHPRLDLGGGLGDNVTMLPASVKPAISIEDLEKIDVRVGTILAAHPVPRSRKLVRLSVDFGDHTRDVLAGIAAERDDPGEVVGRQALFVVNLPPRTMAGEVSEAMLFDIGYADGVRPVLAVPEAAVPNGSRAG